MKKLSPEEVSELLLEQQDALGAMVLDDARKRRALLETAKGKPASYLSFWIAIVIANLVLVFVDDLDFLRYFAIAAVVCVAGIALSKINSRIDALIDLLEFEQSFDETE